MMFRSLIAAVMALGLAAACTTTDQYGNVTRNNTGTGILAGAAAGALLGTLPLAFSQCYPQRRRLARDGVARACGQGRREACGG